MFAHAETVSTSGFSPSQSDATVPSSRSVPLSYTLYEPEDGESPKAPPVIVLDAIFGVRSGWSELSQAIASQTGRNVYTVDARNHGDSPHTSDMDYALMAADMELFMREHGLPKAAFVGHSMGGRTVMRLALKTPSLVERIVVVDVGPSSVPAIVGNYLIPQQLDAMDAVLPLLSADLSVEEAHREADRMLAGKATLEERRARGHPARVPQRPHRDRRRRGPLGPPGQARGFPEPGQKLRAAAGVNYASAITCRCAVSL
ncbi:sn-1-specific diacylglycerol lipase ABHD11-like isoform X2 [Dermacentor andersoni]|uniref:sn-1-specific diacylglycerol lipase ABHD11-like isoform X2 n=1 Tax=Dermacentor andersoni TaxID=34620 RepID=UPI003B3B9CA5